MSRLTRSDVVEAALELIETGGIAALTIPAVALKLNIRPPSLYNHIESINDLRRELSIRGMRQVCEVWRRAVAGKRGDEAIIHGTEAYRKFAREHPALYSLSIIVPPSSDREWSQAFDDLLPLWLDVLQDYGPDPVRTRYAARALRSMIHGFVDLEINGGLLEDIDLDKSFEAIVHCLLSGIRSLSKS